MKIVPDDRDFRDDELHGALRAEYASPDSEQYWAMLERRIMTRIGTDGVREWWSYFAAWSRAGLAAAALALLAAGIATWQSNKAQEQVAVREVLELEDELSILTETSGTEPRARRRDATLRSLLSK